VSSYHRWFESACNEHDRGYGTCLKPKLDTDLEFYTNMMNSCASAFPSPGAGRSDCEATAQTYASAVVMIGDRFYNDAQRAACVCCE